MRRLLRQALTVLSGRTLIRAVQFVTLIILVRSLSTSEFGWFGVLTSAFALVGILGSFGLRQSFAYDIGNNRITVAEVLGTALVILPILVVPSAAIVSLLYARQLPGFSLFYGIALITAGVFSAIAMSLLQGVFLGTGDIRSFTVSEALPHILVSAFVVAFYIFATTTFEVGVWAQSLAGVVAFPLLFFLALGRGGRLRVRLDRLFRMFRYGLVFAFNLFAIMLSYRISMFVIQYFGGSSAAGQYFAAVRVNEIFLEVASALGMVLFSNSARNGSDAKDTIIGTARLGAALFWLFLLISLIIAFSAPLLLRFVVGDDYSEAASLLQILVIAMPATAACKVIYPSLAGLGRASFGTLLVVSSLIVNGVAAILLVPLIGSVGGCVGLVLGQYLLLALYIARCRKAFGVTVLDFLWPFQRSTT